MKRLSKRERLILLNKGLINLDNKILAKHKKEDREINKEIKELQRKLKKETTQNGKYPFSKGRLEAGIKLNKKEKRIIKKGLYKGIPKKYPSGNKIPLKLRKKIYAEKKSK